MKKKIAIFSVPVIAALLIGIFFGNVIFPCPCDTDDYVGELKIMGERVISKNIIPINYNKLNAVLQKYAPCPESVDCVVEDIKLTNIYGTANYTEKDRLILMTQIVDELYEEMSFLYDRRITFVFKDAENQENIKEITVESNRWSEKD